MCVNGPILANNTRLLLLLACQGTNNYNKPAAIFVQSIRAGS